MTDADPNHDGTAEDDPDGGDATEDPHDGGPPDGWRVLVPVKILENASVPRGIVEFLRPLPLVLMGYYVVPDQTAPGQARLQFEDRAEDALREIAEEIEASGGTVETRLVFTDDREASFDRVAAETDCDVVLIPNPAANVDRVLLPARSDVNVSRLAGFLGALLAGRDIDVTLYHAATDESAASDASDVLAAFGDALVENGIARESVFTSVEVTEEPLEGIATAAEDHDAVVMSESDPSVATFVFGDFSERVVNRSLNPVLVVRSVHTGE